MPRNRSSRNRNPPGTGTGTRAGAGTRTRAGAGNRPGAGSYFRHRTAGSPAKTLTELQEKALEIADRYKDLPLQAKIDVIAQAFGCKTGEIHTSPVPAKWRGTSDMTIRFDNGASLFIGNRLTPKAKTVKVQTECVNRTLVRITTRRSSRPPRKRPCLRCCSGRPRTTRSRPKKGLKPYTLLNVEFNEGADEKTGGYIGWYYVTLAVDGKICTHLETD